MSDQPKMVSRQEVYERVWKSGITRVAKELGYSYLEMVRICDELQIPRPTGGYWYRLAHGGSSEQLALPPATEGMRLEIPFGHRIQEEVPPEPPDYVERAGSAEGANGCEGDAGTTSGKQVARNKEGAPGDGKGLDGAPEPESDAGEEVVEEAVASWKAPVPKFPDVVTLTRKQLHEHIWQTPCLHLAKALGISDVALKKTCRQMNVPFPPRGYWARLQAGQTVEKAALPATTAKTRTEWTFDVAFNSARRVEWAAENLITAGKSKTPGAIELPGPGATLHPIAAAHEEALLKAKPGELGFVEVERRDLFDCKVTAALAPRVVAAVHALAMEIERRGFKLVPGTSKEDGLSIKKGDGKDDVWLEFYELTRVEEREPTTEEKRKPAWTWQLTETKPTGELTIAVDAYGLRGKRKWSDGEGVALAEVLGRIVEKIAATFAGFEAQRFREAERERQWKEEQKRRAEQEAKEAALEAERAKKRKEQERLARHAKKLEEIAEERRDNLATAAQQWIESEGILAFVQTCELRWKAAGGGKLTSEQAAWIEWARSQGTAATPWAKGYPEPCADGPLDTAKIPVGGPYPEARLLEEAPPFPDPLPTPEVKTVYVQTPAPKEQFPFWLLHRKH